MHKDVKIEERILSRALRQSLSGRFQGFLGV